MHLLTAAQWRRSVQDIGGEVLCVSQFTLLAATKKNKPDFRAAMAGDDAKRLYQYFYGKVQAGYRPDRVKDGVFQAMMEVALVNDGPVSLSRLSGCLAAAQPHLLSPCPVLTTRPSKVTLELVALPKEPTAPTASSAAASAAHDTVNS